jgi:hypothetical protein
MRRATHLLPLAGLCLSAACASPRAPGEGDRPPATAGGHATVDHGDSPAPALVVVELFSSEGCSSCPPADAVLADLAARPLDDGTVVVALEHHVDYWDDLGWRDPYASEASTDRQRRYRATRGSTTIFTPEVVVDGVASMLGSRRGAIEDAVRRRAALPRLPVTAALAEDGHALRVTLQRAPDRPAQIVVAVIEEGIATSIPRGENAGATVRHGPVVRWLGSGGDAAAGERTVDLGAPVEGERRAAVAFVQAAPQREILGAAIAR